MSAWPEVLLVSLIVLVFLGQAWAALFGPPEPEGTPRPLVRLPPVCSWPTLHTWTPFTHGGHGREWCTRCGYARQVPAWRGHLVRLAARVFHVERPSDPESPQGAQGGPNTPRSDFRAAVGPARPRPRDAEGRSVPCTCTFTRPCPQHETRPEPACACTACQGCPCDWCVKARIEIAREP